MTNTIVHGNIARLVLGGALALFMSVSAMAETGLLAAVGSGGDTLVWTGKGGDGKWSNNDNWATTPDWDAHVAPLGTVTDAINNAYNFDFTAITSDTTMINDRTRWVGDMTFAANAGTITINRGAEIGCTIQSKSTATWTVPAGTKLVNNMPMSAFWNCSWAAYEQYALSFTLTITGGGEFHQVGQCDGSYNTDNWVFDGVTAYIDYGMSAKALSSTLTLKNGAILTQSKSYTYANIESLSANDELRIPEGYNIYLRACSKTFAGKVTGKGTLCFYGKRQMKFTGDLSGFSGRFYTRHGDVELAGAPAAGASIESADAGVATLKADTTVASLSGTAATGGVKIEAGRTLTDATSKSTTYAARLVGDGSFVKDGSGTLTLANDNAYAGSTRVKGGTLVLADSSMNLNSDIWAHYSFDKDLSDVSGCGHALNYSAQTIVSGGKFGNCARYDRNGNATVANVDCISGNHPFTVSVWAKPTEWCWTNRSSRIFSAHYEWSTDAHGDITQYKNGPFMLMSKDADVISVGGMGDCTLPHIRSYYCDSWHHYVITQSETERKFYVDGDLIKTVLRPNGQSSGNESQPWQVSCEKLGIGVSFEGELDEVLIMKRELSADEVTALYARNEIPQTYDTAAILPDPIAHWAFDDDQDPGKDSSGNGYHLTARADKDAPILVAHDNIFGKAFEKNNTDASFYYGDGTTLPPKFPRGHKSFSVQIRGDFSNRSMNSSIFEFGMLTADSKNASFSIGGKDDPVKFGYKVSDAKGGCDVEVKDSDGNSSWGGSGYLTYTFVYDATASKMSVYRDGVEVLGPTAANVTFDANGAGSIAVAYCKVADKTEKSAKIDDLQVYDVALSASQVRESVRLIGRDSVGSVLPKTTALTVDDGATLCVHSGVQPVELLSGGGTIEMYKGTTLEVTRADSTTPFTGTISFGGKVVFAEQSTFSVSEDQPTFAVMNGTMALPKSATVALSDSMDDIFAAGRKTLTLCSATNLEGVDFSQWNVTPASDRLRTELFVENGMLKLLLRPLKGLLLTIR